MLIVTTYHVKPFLSKEETTELMATFAEAGPGPGEIAHYVSADGGGGVVIAEVDDIVDSYRNALKYTQWMEFESQVVLKVDDAVGPIMEALA